MSHETHQISQGSPSINSMKPIRYLQDRHQISPGHP